MTEIKIVNNDEELNQVFNFLSKTIYDDTILHKEKYYPMSERLEEIKSQLKIDKDFLMYIEENNHIVAATMYERSAIVLERYLDKLFGFNKEKNNSWYSSCITIKKKTWLCN